MTDRRTIVVWHDAHTDRAGGWVLPENRDMEPYTVTSIGFRVDDKPGHVSIAQSVGDDEALDSILHIPEGMVQSVEEW